MEEHQIRCLRAVEQYVGGRNALAEKLGVTPGAIAKWVHNQNIPKAHIILLVKLSGGRFKPEDFFSEPLGDIWKR